MTTHTLAIHQDSAAADVVSKAVIRSAQQLELSQAVVASILGTSGATASRLFGGRYKLHPSRKREWEFALLFIRLYRSLDAIAGHGKEAITWLNGDNTALLGKPVELIQTAEGLIRVLHYLDAYRGRI